VCTGRFIRWTMNSTQNFRASTEIQRGSSVIVLLLLVVILECLPKTEDEDECDDEDDRRFVPGNARPSRAVVGALADHINCPSGATIW